MVARLTPDQKAACSNHVGVIFHFLFRNKKTFRHLKSFRKKTMGYCNTFHFFVLC